MSKERKLTVGTVNPGGDVILPVYENKTARNNTLPAPVPGELFYNMERKQVQLYTLDGKWV